MPRRSPSRLPAGMLAATALEAQETLENGHPLADRLLPPGGDPVRVSLGDPIWIPRDRPEPGAP